ncbi:MAG: Hsp33 family molecular chaperone HslO, partial [Pseudohongiellaceae bacterium]
MTDTSTSATGARFLFEEHIRGEVIQLEKAYQDVIGIHQYAPAVSRLLGEFMAAAALLATTLKFEGKLILQARSEGQVPLLMAECDNALNLRAIARGAQQATADRFDQLLAGGQLAITIDPTHGNRYQGIVP